MKKTLNKTLFLLALGVVVLATWACGNGGGGGGADVGSGEVVEYLVCLRHSYRIQCR